MKPENLVINISIPVKIIFDKPSKARVVYNKKYNISGYGKTTEKAIRMFRVQVEELLKFTPKTTWTHQHSQGHSVGGPTDTTFEIPRFS